MQERKEVAAKMKAQEELSAEELEKIEGAIPDWKKGAVVMTDQPQQEEKPGLFKRLRNKVSSRISETEAMKNFKETDDYKKIDEMRKEMREFKHNLKDEIDSTQNPVVQTGRQMADLVFMESSCGQAIKEMQKYDSYFNLEELCFEAEEIFKEFFCNFLTGNVEYLETVAGGQALAITKSDIKVRRQEKWRYLYEDILESGQLNFTGGMINEKGAP